MSEPKYTGSAFPIEGGELSGLYPDPGMSLRDWFAGQALAGFSANPQWLDDSWAETAEAAYEQADAMIRARGETT